MKGSQPSERRGGRKKGTQNLARARGGLVAAACDRVGVNPFEKMAAIAKNDNHPEHFRANAELATYLAPKLRAVEHTGPGGGAIEVNVNPRELLARKIAELRPAVRPDHSESERTGS